MPVSLPAEIAGFCGAQGFVPEEELESGHCSRVFADRSRVLKLPFQGEELTAGLVASQYLEAAGGPRVFAVNTSPPAVLMERLSPGYGLADAPGSEEERQDTFIRLAAAIRRLPTEGAMNIPNYFAASGEPRTAEFSDLMTELMETTTETVFLHGDLHHANILFDGQSWRPIDPKGLVGDPHFEPVAYLRNPFSLLENIDNLTEFTRARIRRICEKTGLCASRIICWALLDRLDESDQPPGPWRDLCNVYRELRAG